MDRGSHLNRYATQLNAVEINSSFYRPHQRKTYDRWARSTPAEFRFSVKMPKAITHDRQLVNCGPSLDRFVSEVTGLGDKLGVLLVQLPPKSRFDEGVVDRFFHELRMRIDVPVAVEPRNVSWIVPSVDNWLAERRITVVAADPPPVVGAGKPGGWNYLTYYRWHGSPVIYFSDYDANALMSFKRRVEESRTRSASTWCIFDNTGSGAAFGNALALSRG